ncbi:MAG: DUF6036 family nucleotidyltransferase [Acidobacteriota bacterium]
MMDAPANAFTAFCQRAFDFLEHSGLPHLVIGGLAVGVVGEARTTADVDVIGFASVDDALALIVRAADAGFEVQPDVERERLRATGTLRFRRGPFQLDVILASLPFEDVAHRRAVRRRLFGRVVSFPTPEDLIVFKILAGRDKDMLDAVGVARRHLMTLDRVYLEQTVQNICDLAEDMEPWRRLHSVLGKAGE